MAILYLSCPVHHHLKQCFVGKRGKMLHNAELKVQQILLKATEYSIPTRQSEKRQLHHTIVILSDSLSSQWSKQNAEPNVSKMESALLKKII